MNFVRFRKKKVVIGGLWGALIMLVISSVIAFFWYNSSKEKQIVLESEYKQMEEDLQAWAGQNNTVYSLAEDVKAGTEITEDMLQEVIVPDRGTTFDAINLALLDDGLFARLDLPANTILTETLVYKEEYLTHDVRENQFSFVVLPEKIEVGGKVDIRIQFPNGDDYIVLSKKEVLDYNSATIWMNLNEGEMLTMSSAMVDAYLEEGKIYAVKYVDGQAQAASTITYPVKENVKQLMQESPNIVNIAQFHLEEQNRTRLEAYLKEMEDEDKTAVREGESSSRDNGAKAKEEAEEELSTYDEVFDNNSNTTADGE